MTIQRKKLFGLDSLIESIKSWCNTRFASLNHTHSAASITGLTTGIGFPNYAAGSNINSESGTVASNGWLAIKCIQTTNGVEDYPVSATFKINGKIAASFGVVNHNGSIMAYNSVMIPIAANTSYAVTGSTTNYATYLKFTITFFPMI